MSTAIRYDPLTPEMLADPYPVLHQLRAQEPVHYCETIGGWVLTRYDDVLAALRDPRLSADRIRPYLRRLSDEERARQSAIATLADWMVFTDPPDHTRLRALVTKAFTPRVVEGLRGSIQQVVNELLDAVQTDGEMDAIADFAYPLPATVIARMLGVPPEDRDKFRAWSDGLAEFVGGALGAAERREHAQQCLTELTEYFGGVIAERRAAPRDDLMTALIAARDEGDKLSEDELIATCVLLLFAGHETTTNLIGSGLLALLRNREQLEMLRDDPALIDDAVEEFLRYDSPVQAAARVTLEDIEIRGTTIAKGQRVFPLITAASRDPAQFPDPDRLDITREPNRHLAFGYGIHFCVGAPLARLEAQLAIPTLLRRMPDLCLLTDEPPWKQTFLLRGLQSLPVAF